MNGGYIMIDCLGLNLLAEASQTIAGLHARITEALKAGKVIYACNCNYGANTPLSPFAVMVSKDSTTYVCTASIYQFSVTSADAVTVTNLTDSTEADANANANANMRTTKSTKK